MIKTKFMLRNIHMLVRNLKNTKKKPIVFKHWMEKTTFLTWEKETDDFTCGGKLFHRCMVQHVM